MSGSGKQNIRHSKKVNIFSGSFLCVESELLFKMVPCGYCILVIFSNYFSVSLEMKKNRLNFPFFTVK